MIRERPRYHMQLPRSKPGPVRHWQQPIWLDVLEVLNAVARMSEILLVSLLSPLLSLLPQPLEAGFRFHLTAYRVVSTVYG